MRNSRQKVERVLAERCEREFAAVVGHGSTAIALALRIAARLHGPAGEVILPTAVCPSLAQVVRYVGFRPVFADIDPTSGNPTVDTIRAHLTAATRAVLAVHLYGHPAPLAAISRLVAGRSLVVIEDSAQSLGGRADGRPMGAGGDFSVLSFGGTKIVQAGSGGALLWNRPEYGALVREELASLPEFTSSPRRALLALSHRNLYHGLIDLLRVDASVPAHKAFASLIDRYRELYFHRLGADDEWDRRVLQGLDGLETALRRRLDRAEAYDAALDHPRVRRCSGWRESGVVWRYTFTVDTPEAAQAVTAAIRRARLNASNHYWSVADLMAGQKDLPGARYFCPRVINLWVDDAVPDADLARTGEVIRRELDR